MKYILFIALLCLTLTSCEDKTVSKGRKMYELYFEQNLKDPDSFVVYEEAYEKVEGEVKWHIEYGARNGFGGMVRESIDFGSNILYLNINNECYKLDKGKLVKLY